MTVHYHEPIKPPRRFGPPFVYKGLYFPPGANARAIYGGIAIGATLSAPISTTSVRWSPWLMLS